MARTTKKFKINDFVTVTAERITWMRTCLDAIYGPDLTASMVPTDALMWAMADLDPPKGRAVKFSPDLKGVVCVSLSNLYGRDECFLEPKDLILLKKKGGKKKK